MIKDVEGDKGYGPGTKFVFFDHVPGPYAVEYLPSQPEPRVDERQFHKDADPKADWDVIFEDRDHFILHFENKKPTPH
jgi:hypothetical protein